MSPLRIRAIARQDLQILRRDPFFVLVTTVMPLLLMGFLNPGMEGALARSGLPGVGGAAQVVPGMSVVFAFLSVALLGYGMFREHGWNTWDRLRSTQAGTADIMVGKALVPVGVLAVQLLLFFGLGGLLTGLEVRGSLVALAFVAAMTELTVITLGLLLVAVCRNVMQLNAAANLGSIVFAGLGGALAPVGVLPGWVHAVGRVTPGYWAMDGFRSVIIFGAGVTGTLRPAAALFAFSVAFAGLAWRRFRVEESKGVSWV